MTLTVSPPSLFQRLRAATRILLVRGDAAIVCSFCGRDKAQTQWIVAGPGIAICWECAGICQSACHSEAGKPSSGSRLVFIPQVLQNGEQLSPDALTDLEQRLTNIAMRHGGTLGIFNLLRAKTGDHLSFDFIVPESVVIPEVPVLIEETRRDLSFNGPHWTNTR